jgi:hypothetical protein
MSTTSFIKLFKFLWHLLLYFILFYVKCYNYKNHWTYEDWAIFLREHGKNQTFLNWKCMVTIGIRLTIKSRMKLMIKINETKTWFWSIKSLNYDIYVSLKLSVPILSLFYSHFYKMCVSEMFLLSYISYM